MSLEAYKHYVKWKSIATVGVWVGTGIGVVFSPESAPICFMAAVLGTLLVWLAASQVEMK